MKKLLLAAALATLGVPAQAATTVFTDNFDSNSLALNSAPSGWTVKWGTVDIIGDGYFDFIPGSGKYIDLDGSMNNAGVLTHSFSAVAGQQYQLSFDLAGNHRDTSTEYVTVLFGTTALTYTLPEDAGWTHTVLNFTPLLSGTRYMSFAAWGGDNVGMLLDNVTVTAVPEPETYAMMMAGLGMIGLMARRRRRS
jgi:hypothetical protein